MLLSRIYYMTIQEKLVDPAVLGDYGTDASVKKMKALTPGQNGLD